MNQEEYLHEKSPYGSQNSRAEIRLSEDKMTALLDLYAPFGKGALLDQQYIRSLLTAEGITENIDWETVNDAILKCNLEHKNIHDLKVAHGQKPVSQYPEHFKLLPRFFQSYFPPEENKSIDHKARSPFILVRKNEKIGEKKQSRDGIPGFLVTGEPLAFEIDQRKIFIPGENINEKDDCIFAACAGQFVLQNQNFWISRDAHIKTNVDYHTGHLHFPGNVIIDGEVLEGFNVFITGDLTCKQSVEAGHIIVKGNLTIAQGIIGKKEARIQVGGHLETKFAENCLIQCRGNVKIKGSLVSSKIYSFGSLSMGDRGHIIGGKIHAVHGIECYEIGNKALVHTSVQCGTDFTAQQQLDTLRQKQIAVAMKIQTLEGMMASHPSEQIGVMIEKSRAFLEKINAIMINLDQKLLSSTSARITVKGKVHPGSTIEICGAELNVTSEIKSSTFAYDSDKKIIVILKA